MEQSRSISLRDATRRSVITGNENVARRVAEQIGLYVQTNVDILQSVAGNLTDTNLAQWQQDRILKNAVLDFSEFREITLYDAAGAQLASSRVGQSKLQFPQSGTSFGSEHHALADRHRRRFPANRRRRHQADAARPKLRIACRRNQPRRNVADGRSDSRRRSGLCARRRRATDS